MIVYFWPDRLISNGQRLSLLPGFSLGVPLFSTRNRSWNSLGGILTLLPLLSDSKRLFVLCSRFTRDYHVISTGFDTISLDNFYQVWFGKALYLAVTPWTSQKTHSKRFTPWDIWRETLHENIKWKTTLCAAERKTFNVTRGAFE